MVVPLTMPRIAVDRVGREVGRERPEDRDPAGDRRLEAERAPARAGDRLELRPVVGDDVLVGGHDRLAGAERGRDQRAGRLVAAHQLDDDVGLGVGHEVGRGIGQELRRDAARRAPRPGRGRRRRPAPAARRRRRRAARGCSSSAAHDLAPDRARAEHGDAQRGTAHRAAGRSRPASGDGHRANGSRPVPGSPERARRVIGRRLHSRAMTTELAPAPAPIAAPRRTAADLLRDPAVRDRPPRQRPRARSATTCALQAEYEAIYCIVDYHALTSTHDPDVLRARTREMAAVAAGPRPRPGALHAVRPEPPPGAHRAGLAPRDGHAGQLARADADLQGEEGPAARRRQPRPAHLPGPAGGRHRHLQGDARAGRQGPGRPPRAVAARSSAPSTAATATRSRSRRRSSPRRPTSSARTASAR